MLKNDKPTRENKHQTIIFLMLQNDSNRQWKRLSEATRYPSVPTTISSRYIATPVMG